MAIKDRILNIFNQKQPESTKIIRKINTVGLPRENSGIQEWINAIDAAEDDYNNPDKYELIRLFNEIGTDAHLSSLIQTRKLNVLSTKLFFCDENGDVDDEVTNLINKQWLYDFIDICLDSIFYGYEVIQFGDIIDNEFTSVEKIPEENVMPTIHQIKLDAEVNSAHSSDNIYYLEKPYSNWCFPVGKERDLGLLNKACPIVIWKKCGLGSWAEFLEMFAMPFRVCRTDISDEDRKNNAKDMMEDMGSAGWAVMDKEDEIEFPQAGSTSGNSSYKENIETLNAELSKLILGQTMTSDDGSSRSQAEVHESVMMVYASADKKRIGFIIDYKLMPFLIKHGIVSKKYYPKWDEETELKFDQKIKALAMLAPFYRSPAEFVEQFTGLEIDVVLESKEGVKQFLQNIKDSVSTEVYEIYKDFFDVS